MRAAASGSSEWYLLESWNLPGCFKEAVAYNHVPGLANEYRKEAATVHVADLMANALKLGRGGQTRVPELGKEAWALLALDSAVVPVVLEEVEHQHTTAVQTIMGLAS